MTIDDERPSEQSGAPSEDAVTSQQTQGASPTDWMAPNSASTAGPGDRPAVEPPVQPVVPPIEPYAPPAPAAYPAAQPGWSPAPGAWPAAQPGGWPPSAPQSWPPTQQGWPPAAPQSWQPAPPAWPPAPQTWPPTQQGWPPAAPQSWQPPQTWPPAPQTPPPSPDSPGYSAADFSFDNEGRLVGPPFPPHRRPSRLPLILTVLAAVMIAFAGGMVVDHLAVPAVQSQQASQSLKDFTVYEQALQDIRDHFVGRSSLTDQQLLYGSISGLVDSLGDTGHSRFLTPAEYQQMTSQLSGQVAGIGVLIADTNGQLVVDRVLTGSPAEKAGVKAGDQITAVDGASTVGNTFDQLAAKIRGDVGTSVTVSVIHAGASTPTDITMTRALVSAPLVDWGIVPGTHIADIALFEFSDGASDQVKQAIASATNAGATSIVFDLRANPGGLASEAKTVASNFLSSGIVYLEEDASGKQTQITVDTSIVATKLPMVVLVDHNTASAAEIVAGALQDSSRAKVVGVTTVGTGTVLEPFQLSDGSVVLLGVADWLTPAGHRIFGKGITPDQTVALPTGGQPIDPIDLGAMTAAKLQSSSDAQLLAALKDLGS